MRFKTKDLLMRESCDCTRGFHRTTQEVPHSTFNVNLPEKFTNLEDKVETTILLPDYVNVDPCSSCGKTFKLMKLTEITEANDAVVRI